MKPPRGHDVQRMRSSRLLGRRALARRPLSCSLGRATPRALTARSAASVRAPRSLAPSRRWWGVRGISCTRRSPGRKRPQRSSRHIRRPGSIWLKRTSHPHAAASSMRPVEIGARPNRADDFGSRWPYVGRAVGPERSCSTMRPRIGISTGARFSIRSVALQPRMAAAATRQMVWRRPRSGVPPAAIRPRRACKRQRTPRRFIAGSATVDPAGPARYDVDTAGWRLRAQALSPQDCRGFERTGELPGVFKAFVHVTVATL